MAIASTVSTSNFQLITRMSLDNERSVYVIPRDFSETQRFRHQQCLFNSAVGFLSTPIDLSQSQIRVLDSATADGAWLEDFSRLLNPDTSATLIGCDIVEYEGWKARPFEFHCQDLRDPWPEAWNGSFDFVHQKLGLNSVKDPEMRRRAVQGLVNLVKPGGWIQIDEGGVAKLPIKDGDEPFEKLTKYIALFAEPFGLDSRSVDHLKTLWDRIDGLEMDSVGYKEGLSYIGGNAQTEEMRIAGLGQVEGLFTMFRGTIIPSGRVALSKEEYEKLEADVWEQVTKGSGANMFWATTWAKKKV